MIQPSEPVFAEAWQARAFALTLKLSASGYFTQAERTRALSQQLESAPDDGSRYYHHWLAALETLAIEKGLATPTSLSERKTAWELAHHRTPHGQPVELNPDT